MMLAVRFAAVETMKTMIKLYSALDVPFQFINPASDSKRFLKMIGYATIVTLSDFKED
jgi:hypothetical protein